MFLERETPTRIEPCLLDEASVEILDLVASLSGATVSLGAKLPPRSAAGLVDAVGTMNCYYSNLIEGHNTTPREIEAARLGRLETVEERRNLNLEARAHIRLQRDIDERYAAGTLPESASTDFIRWLHREFYTDAPEAMLILRSETRELRMTPGTFRTQPEEAVTVGRHQPPSPESVASFMAHFEQRYRLAPLGPGQRIMAIAAAHHRLNDIHPFLDGNGRVSRLVSHAMRLQAGVGAPAFGRSGAGSGKPHRIQQHGGSYRYAPPRRSRRSGQPVAPRALGDFSVWFPKVCLDQVPFMTTLFALDALMERLRRHVERRDWRPEARPLLERALQQGEVARGDAARTTGLKERSARDLWQSWSPTECSVPTHRKGLFSLRFPQPVVELLFPGLFTES